MSSQLLREALANRTFTPRAIERARTATNTANAQSEVVIRRINEDRNKKSQPIRQEK